MALEFHTSTAMKLHGLNVRTENHGDGLALAVDMKCSVEVPNTKLNEISPALLPMFYMAVETEEEEASIDQLPGIPAKTDSQLPLLRSHELAPAIPLGVEYVGYQVTVDRGLGAKSNLVLSECKVNKLKISPKEGGTVLIEFRIQASMVSDEIVGKLSSYIKAEIHLAMSAPQKKLEAIDGTVGHPGAAAAAEAEKKDEPALTGHEAGDTFAENEKAGKNKDASAVPKPPRKKRGSANKPSLKPREEVGEADVAY